MAFEIDPRSRLVEFLVFSPPRTPPLLMLPDNDVELLLGGFGVFVLRVAPPPRLAEDETALLDAAPTPPGTMNAQGYSTPDTPTPRPTSCPEGPPPDEELPL